MLPALASDTARDIALEEMALFLFMISSNSASLNGVRDESMSLQGAIEKGYICNPLKKQAKQYSCPTLTGLQDRSLSRMVVGVHKGRLARVALGCR